MKNKNAWILGIQIAILIASIFIFVPKFSTGLVSSNGAEQDAISVASQIGRLDVVSLIFSLFGIILALVAFISFFSMKSYIENIAENKAEEIAAKIASEKVDNFATSHNISNIDAKTVSDINTSDAKQIIGDSDDQDS